MTTKTSWFASNIGLVAGLLLAVALDIAWIRWLAIGFIWLMLAAYLAVLFSESKHKYHGKWKPVPVWLWWTVDIVIAALLLSVGWYVTTLAYIASCVCVNLLYGEQQAY